MKAAAHKADVPQARVIHDEASTPVQEGHPHEGVFKLDERQHLHLRRAAGWSVRALEGNVWITQDGDVRDIVLRPGDSFVLDRNSHALLSPLMAKGATRIRLTRVAGRTSAIASRAAPHLSLA
ncbi:MAG TPA: DUF2917 domain-containing protein [Noviherbaspirillum sp.]|nr:DUF2917 domain-containing protein [Noviherbaspirillum sp.]